VRLAVHLLGNYCDDLLVPALRAVARSPAILPCFRFGHDTRAPCGGPRVALHTRKAVVGMRERMVAMKATLHTNQGDIVVTLFPNEAPKTVESFVGLATGEREYRDDAGRTNPTPYFDGLIFHRIISGFMIQGGDPLGRGTGGPGYEYDDEIHPEKQFNKPYLFAMANAGKRMGKGTNGSQFFITVGPTPHLNGKHTIFGEVADGPSREVVDKISSVSTDRNDKPLNDVVIERVTVDREG
jgi:peptidyl-prolyl cis-trans isomerase A (cyclophilin A)